MKWTLALQRQAALAHRSAAVLLLGSSHTMTLRLWADEKALQLLPLWCRGRGAVLQLLQLPLLL